MSQTARTTAPALRPPGWMRWMAHPDRGPIAILLVLMVGFTIGNPRFLTLTNLRAIADASAVPLVVAGALTLVIVMGSIDLSVEGVMATSSIAVSMVVANTVTDTDWGLWGIGLGLAIGAAFGLANGLLHVRLRIPSLMVTLGTWFAGLGIASTLFPRRQPNITAPPFRWLGLERTFGLSRQFYIALAVLVALAVIERFTTLGRNAMALGGNEQIAALNGVRVGRVRIAVFALAGLLFGLAAIMSSARLGVGSVQAGSGQLFLAISAVVIGGTPLQGGRGGIRHTVVGVFILMCLGNGLVLVGVPPAAQMVVQGTIIVAAVVASSWHHRGPARVVK